MEGGNDMNRVKHLTLLALLSFTPSLASAGDLGPLEPLADLHRAVHESLGLPEPLIVQLLEKGAPEEHLPVIGLIAERARVSAEKVFELHRSGLSFLDISIRFGLGPEIFYVPIERDPGPPYGKAWGYYKKTPRAQWSTIRLTDREVIDLANLKLCVDFYAVPADRVVRLRSDGKGFVAIHGELAHGGPPPGKGAKAKKGHGKPPKDKPKPPGRPAPVR
jgi:hypothetical protein